MARVLHKSHSMHTQAKAAPKRFRIKVVAPTGTMYVTDRASVISPNIHAAKVYGERGIKAAVEYAKNTWTGRAVEAEEVK